MELARRLILVLSFTFGIMMFFLVPNGELVKVSVVDATRIQARYGGRFPSDEARRVRELPLSDFVTFLSGKEAPAMNTGCVDMVRDIALKLLHTPMDESLDGHTVEPVGYDKSPTAYYWPAQLSMSCPAFFEPMPRKYVSLPTEAPLLASFSIISTAPDQFRLGSGYSGYPDPPSSVLYPYRFYGLVLMAAGLLCYLFIPRRKPDTSTVTYRPYAMTMADIVGMMLFCMFFTLSFAIAGNVMTMVFDYFPITCIMWFMASISGSILVMTMGHAAMRMEPRKDGVHIAGLKGTRVVTYDQIISIGVKVRRPPKWLRLLLAFGGTATGNVTLMGQAAIQAGASSGWVELELQGGTTAGFWLTNQLGGLLVTNLDSFLMELDSHGVMGARKLYDEIIAAES